MITSLKDQEALTSTLNNVHKSFDDKKLTTNMITALVANAFEVVNTNWSLKSFIAINPLKGFEDQHFFDATKDAAKYFDAESFFPIKKYYDLLDNNEINRELLLKTIDKHFNDIELDNGKSLKTSPLLLKLLEQRVIEEFRQKPEKTYPYSQHINNGRTLDKVNNYMNYLCAAYFDESHATWELPNRDQGFYTCWKKLAPFDDKLSKNRKIKSWIKMLPDSSEKTVVVALETLGLKESDWDEYLKSNLCCQSGWSRFIKWRELNSHNKDFKYKIKTTDFLAVRLIVEIIYLFDYLNFKDKDGLNDFEEFEEQILKKLLQEQNSELEKYNQQIIPDEIKYSDKNLITLIKKSNLNNDVDPEMLRDTELNKIREVIKEFSLRASYIMQMSWELTEHSILLEQISVNQELMSSISAQNKRSTAQMIFCIDVRSEGIRRSIESVANVETLGFAGFFGLPISYKTHKDTNPQAACPVLISPKHVVEEHVHPKSAEDFMDFQINQRISELVYKSYKAQKNNIAAAFIFAEASGLIYLALMLLKTITLKLKLGIEKLFPKEKTKVHFEPNIDLSPTNEHGLSRKEQAFFAETALRLMGLTDNFSEFVLFTGHGSQTENNPYASALDCGACAGQHGGSNAKTLAKVLNTPEIRRTIADNGIKIPDTTVFLGAEHNTTTDEIEIYDIEITHPEKIEKLKELKANLKIAAKLNRVSRNSDESFDIDDAAILAKSIDWSETRPEWGLAGNMAFVIGPRELTKGNNLSNRVFMHSYRQESDPDGTLLETIMGGPMVVTQWINNQYYFSSMDIKNFGSGSKITHNIVGDLGVLQGNMSDLFTGLSLQSVFKSDEELFHKPLRLRVVIHAPYERVENILKRNLNLLTLFRNQWIYLTIIEPDTGSIINVDNFDDL